MSDIKHLDGKKLFGTTIQIVDKLDHETTMPIYGRQWKFGGPIFVDTKENCDALIESKKKYCLEVGHADPSELMFRGRSIAEFSREQLIILLAYESVKQAERLNALQETVGYKEQEQ